MAENNHKKPIAVGVALMAVTFIIQTEMGFADISPEFKEKVRQAQRKDAPEVLEIKVLSVKTREISPAKPPPGVLDKTHPALRDEIQDSRPGTEVIIQAKVMDVHRSRSGVKKEDIINISYNNWPPPLKPIPGSSRGGYTEILKEGKSYRAFLRKQSSNKLYIPAVRHGSFDILDRG